jgi:hypothetical protein
MNRFTNYYDRHGKKYQLDDIIEFPCGSKGVLIDMGNCYGIGSGSPNNYHAEDETDMVELSKGLIIGNINENPELL